MSRYSKVSQIEKFPEDARALSQVLGRVYARLAAAINLLSDGLVCEVTSKSADYSASAGDWLIKMDATSGNLAVTLLAASDVMGKRYIVKKTDATANTVTVSAVSGNIDGAATSVISAARGSIEVVSDGSNYWVI